MSQLLARARQGTPLIDGESATFVWHGVVPPQLIGDWTAWEHGEPVDLARAGRDLWSYTLALPADAYIEYAFWRDGQRVADPFNRRAVPDGLGHRNHFFYMPGAAPTPLARRRAVPRGTLTRHVVESPFFLVGGRRTVRLYRPPAGGPCPLLVVLDGQDYHPRGRLLPVVDNLVARGRIRPSALALVDHGRQARGVEYLCSDAHLGALIEEVLPLAQRELDLLDLRAEPGAHGILGASMGGLMALYAGVRAPKVFGRVLSQSGAFGLSSGEPVAWELIRHGPMLPLRVWLDVGRYEWLLECNRRMQTLLSEKGYDVAYREHNGGHNYACWRNSLPFGLEFLFPASGEFGRE